MTLRSNETEPAPTDLKDYDLDEHTKIRFIPEDVWNVFADHTGRFELTNVEQMKFFCRMRLSLISKKVLERLVRCWHKKRELRYGLCRIRSTWQEKERGKESKYY